MRPRLSHQGLKILFHLLRAQPAECTGADLIRETCVESGTVYPILLRFERLKILESHWEAGTPKDLGRPRRRYYRLTSSGKALANSVFDDFARVPGASLIPERT